MKSTVGEIMEKQADVRKYADSALLVDDTLVGVEVELENCDLSRIKDKNNMTTLTSWWSLEGDGSLRGHYPLELVLRYPCSGDNLVTALFTLQEAMEMVEPDMNERTSLHLHIDMRNVSVEELERIMIVFITLESLLYAYCNEDRSSNAYCVPLSQTHAMLERIGSMFNKTKSSLSNTCRAAHEERYTGLNINSLHKFGSLEVRMHQSTYTAGEIMKWINIILSIVKYAKQADFVSEDFSANVSVRGIDKFVVDVFGDTTEDLLYDGYQNDVLFNIRAAQDVTCFFQNRNAYVAILDEIATPSDTSLFNSFVSKRNK